MLKYCQPRAGLLLVSGLLTLTSAACVPQSNPQSNSALSEPALPESAAISPPAPVVDVPETDAAPIADPYKQAIDRASSAFNISQSAQSQDDWRLVANRWRQAIEFLKTVPPSNANHAKAQDKIAEYQRNLAYAEQQANRTIVAASDGVVVIRPSTSTSDSEVAPTDFAPPSGLVSPPVQPQSTDAKQTFQAPIIARAGGTPVINVVFNGNQEFPMIVDTGASGTLITPQMAALLNVVPVGEASVSTASARDVAFPLGYVQSIAVDGAIAVNVLVAVSGSELDVGLLGHDFFGQFDVTVREDVVEFRER